MTNFTSRLLVAAVGLPLVLGMLWLGGWWLFALLAVAGCVGVHEFVTTARPLRPLAPAVYGGGRLALCGAAVGSTVLGAAWIGLGLGFVLLLRQMHDHGRLIAFTVVLTAFAAATFAYF